MFTACIDIGGTFTDLVLYSRESDLEIFKSPTTPGEFEKGFINVLDVAAQAHKLSLAEFLTRRGLVLALESTVPEDREPLPVEGSLISPSSLISTT